MAYSSYRRANPTARQYTQKWRELVKPYGLKVYPIAFDDKGWIELGIFWDHLTWEEVDPLMGDSVAYLLYDPSTERSTLAVEGKGFHMYPVYSKELLKEIVRFMGVSK